MEEVRSCWEKERKRKWRALQEELPILYKEQPYQRARNEQMEE
jgi:hypothetical protein